MASLFRMTGNLPRRYSKDGRGDWQISDIASHANGDLIVAGFSRELRQTSIDILSSKNKVTFEKTFSHKGEADIDERLVASINTNELVTGCGRKVQVIQTTFGAILSNFTLKRGPVSCLGFNSTKSIIYVGRIDSSDLLVLGREMKLRQTISLPPNKIYGVIDVAAFDDRIIVCSASGHLMSSGNVSMIDDSTNQTIAEYRTVLGNHFCPKSIVLREDTKSLLILWSFTSASGYDSEFEYHITHHSLEVGKGYCQALCVLTESARKIAATSDDKLAILDSDGDITYTDTADFFSFDNLMKSLSELLHNEDCMKLCTHFRFNEEQAVKLFTSRKPGKSVLNALEEKRIVKRTDVTSLQEAFIMLNMPSALHLVEGYRTKTKTPFPSTFEKFVAEFSTFLTSNHFEAVCEHFKISSSEKSEILSDNSPGLSLLGKLKEKNIITPTDVRALEIPAFSQLKQVMAKINRYQNDIKEREMSLEGNQRELTLEEKSEMFIDYLHLSIQRWYESICPLPWKKASKWDLSDLFIGCGLTLTNTKSQTVLKNIDPKCAVTYGDIFTHKELQDAFRIVVEGNPGSGKTMLASQIAYDWMNGKIEDIKYAVFLQLKYVEDMTIPEAIVKLILPVESSLTEADVETILAGAGSFKVCLILDGLEEYTAGGNNSDPSQSEVMKVMKREKFSDCKVILTTRSEYLQDLPKCPMLKIRPFGEKDRDTYVEKVFPDDAEKQKKVIATVENNPLLLELCDVPLLFVIIVHNIERMTKLPGDETDKVTPFVRSIEKILCSIGGEETQGEMEEGQGTGSSDSEEEDTIDSDDSDSFRLSLAEVAFNGLCTGKQQLSWPMNFVQDKISDVRSWIDSGILIVEEEVKRFDEDIIERSDVTPKQTSLTETVADYPSTSEKKEEGPFAPMDIDETPKTRGDYGSSSAVDEGVRIEGKEQAIPLSPEMEITKNAITVLQARFLHKIIQEWFAAQHLANILENCNQEETDRHLNLISPVELHYILRFACGINAKITPLILEHLRRHYQEPDEDKRRPVSDCFCLCFLEHSGDKENLKESVRDICKEGITICEEDSRQLQKAKASLLNFASGNKILVQKLKLIDVCKRLDTKENVTRLYLNSGVYLTPLQEVYSLVIKSWDPKLEEFNFPLLMNYLKDWPSLQEAELHFPVSPPTIEEEISLIHKKVTWSIGPTTFHLSESGEWLLRTDMGTDPSPVSGQNEGRKLKGESKPMQLVPEVSSAVVMVDTGEHASESQDNRSRLEESERPQKRRRTSHDEKDTIITYANTLKVKATVSQKGGSIHIENSGVELVFPPNAFHGGSGDHLIQMRIIPRGTFEEPAKSFSDESSVIVELLPDKLRLRNPAVLTLPHCLVLKDCEKCKVRIFTSHHEKGDNPVWEDITASTRYMLSESHCKIWLQRFCWVTYTIDDEEVEAKKLQLYTAGKKYKPGAKRVTIDVGYYPDLPGEYERFLEKTQNQPIIGCTQSFIFRRMPKDDLCITLTQALPQTWIILPPGPSKKTISYSKIELSCEQKCFFTFCRQGEDPELPYCTFNVSQGERDSELYIDMEHEFLEISTTSDAHLEKLEGHKCEHHNLNVSVATSPHGTIKGDHSMIEPGPATFPSHSKSDTGDDTWDKLQRSLSLPPRARPEMYQVPQYQTLSFGIPSPNQIPYQQSHLISGMEFMSLTPSTSSQYPTCATSGVRLPLWRPGPSSILSGLNTLQEDICPISFKLMNELELRLGVPDTFNQDWRMLAENLGFKHNEILYFEKADTPTIAVLRVASKRGYFKTVDDLITILKKMERLDVVAILSKHLEATEACTDS